MYQNKRYTKLYTEKGITLVALVVTIIILLVLAGITVASLTGDNGLIGKSGEAKKQTEISEALEQLEIAVTQSTNKRGNIDETKLAKNLSKINGLKYINTENEEIDVTENTEIKLTAKVKLKGNTFKINDEGNISYKKDGTIDNEDIINSPETYYGHYVTNYNSPNDAGIVDEEGQLGKWQIFMADDTNIYLIANNFITQQYTGTKNNVGYNFNQSYPTRIWFSSIIDEYNAGPITTDIPNILSKFDSRTNSIYHTWMNTSSNQIRNLDNEKAVASILDVDNIWRGYINTTYAKYSIGSPTLEMLCKAYNDSHTGIKIESIIVNENDEYGYRIKKIEGETETGANNGLTGLTTGAKNSLVNGMYFKYTSVGADYWIASPTVGGGGLFCVNSNGSIYANGYRWTGGGFRPLVCLKSNVNIVLNEDCQTYSLELD